MEGGSERLTALANQLKQHKPASPIQPLLPQNTLNRISSSGVTNQGLEPKRRRAAVLICIFESDDGDLRVFLTKRSSRLSSHSGEVSLPGGKWEEGDEDDIQTALREAHEEIGLEPSLVHVVAQLQSFTNKIGITVIPVIGLLLDKVAYVPAPNPAEVEAIFDVPLEMFLKDEDRRGEEREWMGDKYLLHYFEYKASDGEKYVIWALTAGILITAASLVYQRSPDFVERMPKFWNNEFSRDDCKL
uniref:Nudix hydrolase domain-containing protein n=1 Tax=Kalanchoe fedtschenkoi TaxID=63787 RepID=A0A7N0UP04_KALFE